jgi:D-hexose-6-phosphate mutarotase
MVNLHQMDIDLLNKRFSIDSALLFRKLSSGTILAEIDTPLATASVSLEGGQVVTWHPKSQVEPVLWVSKRAQFVPGKAIRGGVPVCWPWFGMHPKNPKLPGHGYARITPWKVTSSEMLKNGTVCLSLVLGPNKQSEEHWPHKVGLMIEIIVGESLIMKLTTMNHCNQKITYTEGLHTYFNIGDVSTTQVKGLDGIEYLDLTRNNMRLRQNGSIAIEGELGRIFLNTQAVCVIEDHTFNRRIRIDKEGSLSTAVWNPGLATAATMADLGGDGWRNMVCVEGANAHENTIILESMQAHTQTAKYSVDYYSISE